MHGAAYGSGIYLSPKSGTSFGYTNRYHSSQGKVNEQPSFNYTIISYFYCTYNFVLHWVGVSRAQAVIQTWCITAVKIVSLCTHGWMYACAVPLIYIHPIPNMYFNKIWNRIIMVKWDKDYHYYVLLLVYCNVVGNRRVKYFGWKAWLDLYSTMWRWVMCNFLVHNEMELVTQEMSYCDKLFLRTNVL